MDGDVRTKKSQSAFSLNLSNLPSRDAALKKNPNCFLKSLLLPNKLNRYLDFAGFGAIGVATDGGGVDSFPLLRRLAHRSWARSSSSPFALLLLLICTQIDLNL
jgi:hypothetical protein